MKNNEETAPKLKDDEIFTPDVIDPADVVEVEPGLGDNLAGDEKIVKKIADLGYTYFERYKTSHDTMRDDVWAKADYMWRCGKNSDTRNAASNDDTLADTGSTLFYRQVRTLSSFLVSILGSSDYPWKYVPIYSSGLFSKYDEGKWLAEQNNILAQWTRKEDDWIKKTSEICHELTKYGNLPVMVGWNRTYRKLKRRKPVYASPTSPDEPPTIIGFEVKEEDVVKNHPTFYSWPLDDFFADPNVELQKQNCIIMRSLVNYADLYEGERSGWFENVDKIGPEDAYSGEDEDTMRRKAQENMGLDTFDDTQTNLFKRWDVWVRVPISDKGKWDAKKNEPVWYWCVFVGNSIQDAKCVMVRRNYEPNDNFPGIMLHAVPDDSDILYHMSLAQALESNYDEQTTRKNQALDANTLNIRRPKYGIRGEVYTKDLTFQQNKVIWLEKQDSLRDADPVNTDGETLGMLSYLDDDSNKTAGTDKPIMGEPLGGRASATEATNVYQMASQPHMAAAKYVLSAQLLPFVAKGWLALWREFALPDQVVELTGLPKAYEIKPFELWGDYDVQVDVVDEYVTNVVEQQNISWALQTVMPILQPVLDLRKVGTKIFEIAGFKNPQEFFKPDSHMDAEKVAMIENLNLMQGLWDEPKAGEDHETHLAVHQTQLNQYRGMEDRVPFIDLLQQHVEMTKILKEQEGAQTMPQVGAPSGNTTPGMVSGNAIAGQLGALQNAPVQEGLQ